MSELFHHLALGLAVAALSGAAVRTATLTGATGLVRVLAAIPLAAAVAVASSLALGLVALGGSWAALLGAAGAVWLIGRAALPAPVDPPRRELARWWQGRGPGERAVAGAAAGAVAGLAVFALRYPIYGVDGLLYHVAEVGHFVSGGRPGSGHLLIAGLPVASYPLTNEVLLSWGSALSQGLAVMTVAGVLWSALVALAAWTGLREAGAPAPARVLAVIAVLAIPAGVIARHGPLNDLPALAWLSTTAALCVAAVKRPALLAPALVAAGLAGGTKTTALPLAVVALLWAARPVGVPRLRSLVRPLLAALALALACGGVWYLRNLVLKGSPVWPFSRGPFGDPLPRFIVDQGHSLLERPRATLRGYERAYLYLLGGGLVLFVGAAVAAVATRRRAVVALTGLSAASGLLWVAAPFTGVANDPALRDAVLSTLRYLLPALAAAASALAICAATPGWPRRLAYALLVGAIAGDVAGLIKLDVNYPLKLLLGGAAAGGVLAAMARRPVAAVAGNPVAPVAAVCLVLLALGARADGITKRHVLAYESDRELVSWFSAQPAFRDGQQRIWGAPTVPGSLVGDRLRHAVTLIPPDASCARIQGWARDGWIVVTGAADRRLQRQAIHVVRCMPGRPLRFHSATTVVYGPPTGARAST